MTDDPAPPLAARRCRLVTQRFAAERRAPQRSKGAAGVRGHSVVLAPPPTGRDQQNISPPHPSGNIRPSSHKTRRRRRLSPSANREAVIVSGIYDDTGVRKSHLETLDVSRIQDQEVQTSRRRVHRCLLGTTRCRLHPEARLHSHCVWLHATVLPDLRCTSQYPLRHLAYPLLTVPKIHEETGHRSFKYKAIH